MKFSFMHFLIVFVFFVSIPSDNVESIEPITTGVAVSTAVFMSALFASYDKLKSHFFEVCDENWLVPNITGK